MSLWAGYVQSCSGLRLALEHNRHLAFSAVIKTSSCSLASPMCTASVLVLRFEVITCALAQSAGSEVLATYVQVAFLQSRSLRLERVRTDAEQTHKKNHHRSTFHFSCNAVPKSLSWADTACVSDRLDMDVAQ